MPPLLNSPGLDTMLSLDTSVGNDQKTIARHLTCIEYTDGSLACKEVAPPAIMGMPDPEPLHNEQAANLAASIVIILVVLAMLISSFRSRPRTCQVPSCHDRRYLGAAYCRTHYPRHLIEATKSKKTN